jgi:hypothetical protein
MNRLPACRWQRHWPMSQRAMFHPRNPVQKLPKINRRNWLVLDLQRRRRGRRAPVVSPLYPGMLAWVWPYPDPFKWNVWMSADGGATWTLVQDYWAWASARTFSPDGSWQRYFVVGVNEAGVEVTGRSNEVCPDDAPVPPPTLINLYFNPNNTRTGAAAVGQAGDYWNRVANETYGGALLNQQGMATPGTVSVGGYFGGWSTGFADAMMDDFIYNGTSIQISPPTGYWDLYCYTPFLELFTVTLNGVTVVSSAEILAREDPPVEVPFEEGVNYVYFNGVYVGPGDSLVIYTEGKSGDVNALFGFQLLDVT